MCVHVPTVLRECIKSDTDTVTELNNINNSYEHCVISDHYLYPKYKVSKFYKATDWQLIDKLNKYICVGNKEHTNILINDELI